MWNFDSAGPVETKWGAELNFPPTGLGKYDGGQAKYDVMMVFCGNGSERDIKTWAQNL